jgi:hypothetical protein
MKATVYRWLKHRNIEIARLSPDDREECERIGLDPSRFNYKEIQAVRGLAAGGHISPAESRFLGELAATAEARRPIVEVGTLFGASTLVLASWKPPSQRLLTVDNYSWNPLGISPAAHRLATRARLSYAIRHQAVEIVDCDATSFYASYEGPAPALFFCDADHSYEAVLNDLRWARSVGASLIAGHDYDRTLHPGVVRAVDEMGGAREIVGSVYLLH